MSLAGRILVLILVLLTAEIGHAQSPVSFRISVEDGIPNNTIYCLAHAPDGYIWAGSDAGLLRFNGLKWDVFTCPQKKGVAITGLCFSPSGKLYCHNFSGQIFVVTTEMKIVPIDEPDVRNISVDKSGLLWVSGSRGIQSYDEKSGKVNPHTEVNTQLNAAKIVGANNISVDTFNRIWFTVQNGVYCLENRKLTEYTVITEDGNDTLMNTFILKVLPDGVWLFSVAGGTIYHQNGNVFTKYAGSKLSSVLAGRKLTSIKYLNGVMWIGTYSGMVCWDRTHNSVDLFYEHLALTDIIQDSERGFWFSSLYNGIYHCPDLNIVSWDPAAGLNGRTHVTRHVSSPIINYFATETGKIYGFADASSNLTEVPRKSNSDIQFFEYDSLNDEMLFGTNGVLHRLDDGVITTTSIAFPSMKDIVHTRNGYYSAGTYGVLWFAGVSDTATVQTEVKVNSRDLLYVPGSQEVWAAGVNGVQVLQIGGVFGGKLTKTFLDTCSVIKLAGGGEDCPVFALTINGRIYRIENKDTVSLEFAAAPGIQIRDFICYGDEFFCATSNGLLCVNRTTKEHFTADHIFGLPSDDIQCVTISYNQLRLSTGSGLVVMPVNFRRERGLPLLSVSTVTVNGQQEDIIADVPLTIAYNASLIVNASVIGYSSAGKYELCYRFKGDTLWQTIDAKDGTISFWGLPAGDCVIEINLRDHFGRFAGESILIPLDVIPPFWKTWLFYLLCIVLVTAAIIAGFSYRIKLLRTKQLKELRQIKLESDLRSSRQTALAAQMNPHFIFNVLNSIKGFIYGNDRKRANQYLNNFSDLVRRVLEMSARPLVKLEDELEVLRLYVELESMLLEGDFDFALQVDEQIDTNWVKIPSLIIQPFVENVFKHGLRHKQGAKQLRICFELSEKGEVLLVTVTDNGIGRVASAAINDNSRAGHKSFSSDATERRIELLNNMSDGVVGVIYSDGAGGQGTSVKLSIRIKENGDA